MQLLQLSDAMTASYLNLKVRDRVDQDATALCRWVDSGKALALVSADISDGLSPEILGSWEESARKVLVAYSDREYPVGYATVSTSEALGLPSDYAEICHLIVNPHFRGALEIGRVLVLEALRYCGQSGYSRLCGRVHPDNRFGIRLAGLFSAEERLERQPWMVPGFRWFELPVRREARA